MRRALFLTLLLPFLLAVQEPTRPDTFSPFKFFIGTWKGTGQGRSGISQLEREYQYILNGKYIQINHKSIYAPQTMNRKGEIHEDIGLLSYDRNRKQFVLRQFHVEGFVNQYKTETVSPDGKLVVFMSEALENIPAGWRAKETYRILNENEFTETFELAEPGKDFTVYSENRFTRQK